MPYYDTIFLFTYYYYYQKSRNLGNETKPCLIKETSHAASERIEFMYIVLRGIFYNIPIIIISVVMSLGKVYVGCNCIQKDAGEGLIAYVDI